MITLNAEGLPETWVVSVSSMCFRNTIFSNDMFSAFIRKTDDPLFRSVTGCGGSKGGHSGSPRYVQAQGFLRPDMAAMSGEHRRVSARANLTSSLPPSLPSPPRRPGNQVVTPASQVVRARTGAESERAGESSAVRPCAWIHHSLRCGASGWGVDGARLGSRGCRRGSEHSRPRTVAGEGSSLVPNDVCEPACSISTRWHATVLS